MNATYRFKRDSEPEIFYATLPIFSMVKAMN